MARPLKRGEALTDIETFGRLAGVIVLETFALVVWNVGTRPPVNAFRDAFSALRSRRALLGGTLSLLVGLVFVAAATVLLIPAVADVRIDFVPIAIFTFLAALAIEVLVGNDVRTFLARVAGTPRAS